MSLPVVGPETVFMTTRDGVRLDADLYRPAQGGSYPVLLMRQPYGRRIASTVVYAHPRWYAAQGYVVVIQDVRGTGTSEGTFRVFEAEAADGADAVAWAAALPGTTGRVGMYGFSYQGMTQFLALAGGAKLGALAPVMAAWDVYGDWAYEGGSLCFSAGVGWGLQMASLQAARAGHANAFEALRRAARNPPFDDATPAYPDVLRQNAHYGHFSDWIENDRPGAYWDAIAPRAALADNDLDVPMLHIGGWYDQMLMGTLDAYAAAAARSKQPQALVIGPWSHIPWGRRVGAVDFGAEAESAVDRLQCAWFDHHLKDAVVEVASGVTLFDLTLKRWHKFAAWPAATLRALYLTSGGLAAATLSDGALQGQPASDASGDSFVHDPSRPVPSLGGHDVYPSGMHDRAALDGRADVACYTSSVFETETLLAGRIALELWVEADAPSFDVSAVLSEVTPDGRVLNLTQGYCRVDADTPRPLKMSLRATCATLRPGAALRLSLAGASFPAHAVNPGTGARPTDGLALTARTITLSVLSGGRTPSRLLLPDVS